MTGLVRTVLGDVPAGSLGATYAHEHLIFDSAYLAGEQPAIHLPSEDAAAEEAAACHAAGVGAMVDAAPCAAGRGVERLAAVSRRSGVAIVAATGLHTAAWYQHHPWALRAGAEEMAALFVADVEQGIDRFDYTGPVVERTEHRAGIVKIGTLGEEPDDRERRVFAAAARTAAACGVPILTHCEGGRGGPAQVELLTSLGVPVERVCLSHTDKVADPGYHRELLDTGVNVEYDQALRAPDATAALLAKMVEAGYLGQIMLGTDGARRSLWTALGGSPGLAWLYAEFPGRAGLGDEQVQAIFETNPQRFLELAA